MTMGERIRQARLDAGLSQRQLAGEEMTRNMLSALEHDGANPSLGTLRYLSGKLCKPIGYFLGEQQPELAQMDAVRQNYAAGDYRACLDLLETLAEPAFQPERALLRVLCLLELAEQARQEGRIPYSGVLLSQCREALGDCPYLHQELHRQWLIASARIAPPGQRASLLAQIPQEEELLFLRAQAALDTGDGKGALALLAPVSDSQQPTVQYLMGQAYFEMQEYAKAADCLHRAEESFPEETTQKLEICYREMGDYKMAYYYAKKEKTGN